MKKNLLNNLSSNYHLYRTAFNIFTHWHALNFEYPTYNYSFIWHSCTFINMIQWMYHYYYHHHLCKWHCLIFVWKIIQFSGSFEQKVQKNSIYLKLKYFVLSYILIHPCWIKVLISWLCFDSTRHVFTAFCKTLTTTAFRTSVVMEGSTLSS